jgi:hypothetical protein
MNVPLWAYYAHNHIEFLENGLSVREEEEHIRIFIANGTLW